MPASKSRRSPPGDPASLTGKRRYPRCLTAGESAIVVELGDAIDPDLNAAVRRLDAALAEEPFPGFEEAIPTYRSLLVLVNPETVDFDQAEAHLLSLASSTERRGAPHGRRHVIPVRYDGADLEEVAERVGESVDRVVDLHSGRDYIVYMVGFVPGFAYMGPTAKELDLERRATPRVRVPEGSVAIAMGQTGVYPFATPGGWHLLGRADPTSLFQARRTPPALLAPGDRVRFSPVARLPESEGADAGRADLLGPDEGLTPVFLVRDGGLFSTIQDLGRRGYQRFGVPVSGAMDERASVRANRLVGNPDDAATLEVTLSGPELSCLSPAVCALEGANFGALVDRADMSSWEAWPVSAGRAFLMRAGNTLRMRSSSDGARGYLAIRGGFRHPSVLGSRSTYVTGGIGGLDGRPLAAGDRLFSALGIDLNVPSAASRPRKRSDTGVQEIRVVWGPQEDYFSEAARSEFLKTIYRVSSESNRMGYRLEGKPVEHLGAREIISDGMFLGAVQIPPSGLPIVMMADRATTGGYPKIATVARADMSELAQLLPGDRVRFRAISRIDAQRLYRTAAESLEAHS